MISRRQPNDLFEPTQYLLDDIACYFSEKAVDERVMEAEGKPVNKKASEIYDGVAAIIINWLKRDQT